MRNITSDESSSRVTPKDCCNTPIAMHMKTKITTVANKDVAYCGILPNGDQRDIFPQLCGRSQCIT